MHHSPTPVIFPGAQSATCTAESALCGHRWMWQQKPQRVVHVSLFCKSATVMKAPIAALVAFSDSAPWWATKGARCTRTPRDTSPAFLLPNSQLSPPPGLCWGLGFGAPQSFRWEQGAYLWWCGKEKGFLERGELGLIPREVSSGIYSATLLAFGGLKSKHPGEEKEARGMLPSHKWRLSGHKGESSDKIALKVSTASNSESVLELHEFPWKVNSCQWNMQLLVQLRSSVR